jgi:hypothetical protein
MNSRGPCFCRRSVVHREKSGLHWVPYKHSQKFLWEEREALFLSNFLSNKKRNKFSRNGRFKYIDTLHHRYSPNKAIMT